LPSFLVAVREVEKSFATGLSKRHIRENGKIQREATATRTNESRIQMILGTLCITLKIVATMTIIMKRGP
jgi:hypothetical protein